MLQGCGVRSLQVISVGLQFLLVLKVHLLHSTKRRRGFRASPPTHLLLYDSEVTMGLSNEPCQVSHAVTYVMNRLSNFKIDITLFHSEPKYHSKNQG